MHSFQVLKDGFDVLLPIFKEQGFQAPKEGEAVIFAEFDEHGAPVAFLPLQAFAMVEGLWSRDGSANLLILWRMMLRHVQENGMKGQVVMGVTSPKVAQVLETLGCEKLPQTLYGKVV